MEEIKRNLNPNSLAGYRQPKGLSGFEALREQWIKENPEHTERELLKACAEFARSCGLVIRDQVLNRQLAELIGDALNAG
jgi:hypothetical protein